MLLTALVAALSLTAHHDCGAVSPLFNAGAWTNKGNVYIAHYRDNGDSLTWDSKSVPPYVKHLATDNRGTSIRLRCGH